jgi:hypothetical protein
MSATMSPLVGTHSIGVFQRHYFINEILILSLRFIARRFLQAMFTRACTGGDREKELHEQQIPFPMLMVF